MKPSLTHKLAQLGTRLHELARAANTTPEQLLQAGAEAWLAPPGRDFAQASAYVLKKHRELYGRLASPMRWPTIGEAPERHRLS